MRSASNHRRVPVLRAAACGLTCLLPLGSADAQTRSTTDDRAMLTPSQLHAQINQELSVADSTITTIDVDTTPGREHFFEIQLDGQLHTVRTVPHSIRSAGYRLLVSDGNGGLMDAQPGPVRTVRGEIIGIPGSTVAGSLLENGVQLMIDLGAGARFWVEPIDDVLIAGSGQHVVYAQNDVISVGACGTEGEIIDTPDGDEPISDTGDGGIAGVEGECYFFTDLALDSDFPFFQNYNSSVPTTEAQLNSIINTMNLQYESEVAISHVLTAVVVRTSEAEDPYSDTLNHNALLSEFRNHWVSNIPQSEVQRDVAELWTGRDFEGTVIGVANTIGGICTTLAYCTSMNVGSFACRTDLSAHELGHLWNGSHCGCPGNTMNPSLACANNFSPATESSISFHRDSRVCLENECLPANNLCENATQINEGTIGFSTENSTTSGFSELACGFDGSAQIDNDVWYRYTSACAGPVTIGLCNSTFDTRLAVFEFFCPLNSNEVIACADNECGQQSAVTIDAQAGVNYLIRVGGVADAEGTGELTIAGTDCLPPPPNDNCGVAEAIGAGDTAFTTLGATSQGPDETNICGIGGDISNDIWYRIVSGEIVDLCGEEYITISICDADFDTRIAVYSGGCPLSPDDTLINCNDDFCGTGSSVSFLPSEGDVIYRIRIGSADGTVGNGTVNVTCGLPPQPCPTDTDGNGSTDVDDLVAVIIAWGSADPSADVDGSGIVDVDDLVAVILAWGPC